MVKVKHSGLNLQMVKVIHLPMGLSSVKSMAKLKQKDLSLGSKNLMEKLKH